MCVRLGDSLHRAESPLHVWGKGHPVQKATPVPQERPNLGTNSLKFQVGENAPKVLGDSASQDLVHVDQNLDPIYV